MGYYARIDDGVVREVRKFDSVEGKFHPSLTWVEADSTVSVGDRYNSSTESFSKPPEAVVQIDEDEEVQKIRERPRERLEDQSEWIKASKPPNVEERSGYRIARFYNPDKDEWTHEYRKIDAKNLRRDYTSSKSREKIREAIDKGDTNRAVEELAHILTGDDKFDQKD